MTKQEAIEQLETWIDCEAKEKSPVKCTKDEECCTDIGHYCWSVYSLKEAMNIAIQVLQEQLEREQQSKPLTLDKLKERIGKPVWIKYLLTEETEEVECVLFDRIEGDTFPIPHDELFFKRFGTDDELIRWESNYGQKYLVYDYRPKEEQG